MFIEPLKMVVTFAAPLVDIIFPDVDNAVPSKVSAELPSILSAVVAPTAI